MPLPASDPEVPVFAYSRRMIIAAVAAVTFGLFSTSTLPAISGSAGQAQAKKKKKTKKKTVRSSQS